MKRLPYWADGGLFGIFLVPVVFILKIICPLKTGCLVDPFLVPIFSPLFLIEGIVGSGRVSSAGEIFFIMFFWGLVWALIAHLAGSLIKKRENKEIT